MFEEDTQHGHKKMTPEPQETKETQETHRKLISRDEMNLAEFPLTILSERVPKEIKTLVFEDKIKGESGVLVKRTWTITGSDRYGLPRGKDLDVLQALLKISKDNNFSSPTNHFTLSQVIRIMGWKNHGKNYKRVEEALARLLNTTISAEKAFWDNETKSYLTAGFSVLDSYKLWKKEEKPGPKPVYKASPPLSCFTWGSDIFQSFKVGYLKPINLEIFYGFKSNISKRLYQYLDKKKYKKQKFEIGVFYLAYEKLGLSRKYYLSDIKRKLNQAHQELMEVNFLKSFDYKPLESEKNPKIIYHFVSKSQRVKKEKKQPPRSILIENLLQAGVNRGVAEELTNNYPEDLIQKQLQALKFRKIDRNRAGALIKSIKESWSLPEEMVRVDIANKREAETNANRNSEREAEVLFKRYKKVLGAEIEKLKTGVNKESYRRIVQEEEEKLLKKSPKKQMRDSLVFKEMFESLVINRLKSEGFISTFEEWKKSISD